MATTMDILEEYISATGPIDGAEAGLLRQIAYDRLRDGIIHAGLKPGEPLSETRISKALGISRTPVREALQQLAKEGLVQVIPGRAVTVAAPSMQEMLDTLHVRELLEPEVVRLAASSMSATEKEKMSRLTEGLEQAARAGDRPAWSKIDMEWHETLSGSCPNQLLAELTSQVCSRMHHQGSDERVSDQYLIDGTLEHKQIVEAIIAGEAEAAERITREHLRSVRENLFKSLVRY